MLASYYRPGGRAVGYIKTAASTAASNALHVAFTVLCGLWFFRLDGGITAVIVFTAVSAVHAADLQLEGRETDRLVQAARDLEREYDPWNRNKEGGEHVEDGI